MIIEDKTFGAGKKDLRRKGHEDNTRKTSRTRKFIKVTKKNALQSRRRKLKD